MNDLAEGQAGNRYSSLPCIHCGFGLSKTVSTGFRRGRYVRQRQCVKCRKMFNSYEVSPGEMKLLRLIYKLFAEHKDVLAAVEMEDDG